MPGRRVESLGGMRGSGTRPLLLGLGALAVLVLGLVLGSRLASPGSRVVTTNVAGEGSRQYPNSVSSPAAAQTEAGSVAAATSYVTALSGNALLDPNELRRVVERISSKRARRDLVTAYLGASRETRRRLGVTQANPAVFLRVMPVGYRQAAFTSTNAQVLVWRVGVVGGGSAIQPQQVWTTETVDLVWEDGAWKVDDLRSAPGPTPPLAAAASPTGELFATVPAFREFTGVQP